MLSAQKLQLFFSPFTLAFSPNVWTVKHSENRRLILQDVIGLLPGSKVNVLLLGNLYGKCLHVFLMGILYAGARLG